MAERGNVTDEGRLCKTATEGKKEMRGGGEAAEKEGEGEGRGSRLAVRAGAFNQP